MWSPNSKEPQVKMLCHGGATRAVAVDFTGRFVFCLLIARLILTLLLILTVTDLAAMEPCVCMCACDFCIDIEVHCQGADYH